MSSMKQGWELKKLGDVCDIYQPKTISKRLMLIDGKYPVFGANGIIGRYDKYNHELPQLLVTCRGATCGSVNISKPKSWINGNAMVIRPITNDLSLKFIEYFFRGYVNLSKIITGAAQPQITRQNLSPVEIPIPPLEEQKQIVAKLDQAFVVIDKARANASKNLENAKQLFQSKLNEIFSQKGENWVGKRLSDVCDEIFAGGDAPKDNYSKDKTQEYTTPIYANAVKNNGLYGYTNLSRVLTPSVTIAARGSGTGHTEIRIKPFYPIVRLIVLIPNDGFINLYFLRYSIQTLDILRSGSAIPQLTVPMIKEYSIPVPSLSQQVKAVEMLDKLKKQTQSLEFKYQKELSSLEELKKSILQKAFNGELS